MVNPEKQILKMPIPKMLLDMLETILYAENVSEEQIKRIRNRIIWGNPEGYLYEKIEDNSSSGYKYSDPPTFKLVSDPNNLGVVKPVLNKPIYPDPENPGTVYWDDDGSAT